MKHILILLRIGIIVGYGAILLAKGTSQKEKSLNAILAKFRTEHYGFTLVEKNTEKIHMSINANTPLNPASSTKVLTGAVALKKLGVEYKFKTEFYALSEFQNGEINSPLYIKGFGDPSLVEEQVFVIANSLKMKGIRFIKGPIIIDNSYFDNLAHSENNGVGYSSDPYSAEISALSVNFNSIYVQVNPSLKGNSTVFTSYPFEGLNFQNNVKVENLNNKGKVSILRPDKDSNIIEIKGKINKNDTEGLGDYVNITNTHIHAGQVFSTIFKQVGIIIENPEIQEGVVPSSSNLLYTHNSKTLDAIVRDMNKYSNNFIADMLLKTLGATVYGAPGTLEKGCLVLADYLNHIGVLSNEFKLMSGSGLDTRHYISANALTKVLLNAQNDFTINAEFIESLSIAGVDGTVKNRFKTEDVKRKLRVKTGLISGAQSLVGYVETKNGRVFVFSVIVNKSPLSPQEVKDTIDELGVQLVNYSGMP